jgi:hypothetical protein
MTDITGRIQLRELPRVLWKGKTFNQITSSLQLNSNSAIKNDTSVKNAFHAMPVKHYRKEIDIQTIVNPTCNKRLISIDELNSPNGYLLTTDPTVAPNMVGLTNTLDFNLSNSQYDKPNACGQLSTTNSHNGTTTNNCLNQQFNALRRCRSAGMIKKSFNANNVANYFTDTGQYLTGRNKTFEQNQYNYVVSGNNAAMAGSPGAANNVYRPQGQTDCSGGIHISYKPSNSQYANQGAVDSSARTTRAKYNQITTNAGIFYKTLGKATGDAMTYDGSDTAPYTVKAKTAFPNKVVPKFNKYTGEMIKCEHNIIKY